MVPVTVVDKTIDDLCRTWSQATFSSMAEILTTLTTLSAHGTFQQSESTMSMWSLICGTFSQVWRRGSVIASRLLDSTATALLEDPTLSKFAGWVSDSGERRWTIKAAIDEAVPAPVLTASLYERFSSPGEADFANRLLSAMRYGFGGHLEKHRR